MLAVNTREIGDVVIFDIEGDFTRIYIKEPTLHQIVRSSLNEGKRKIILNFDKVVGFDSTAVLEITASHTSTTNLGGKLKLVCISERIYLVFRILGLHRVFNIKSTEEAALKNFT